MPIPVEADVRGILGRNERGVKIYCAAIEAWKSFERNFPQRVRWRRKSSSRHMFWEEFVGQLASVAANDPGMHVEEHCDTVSIIVEDAVLFRIKYADVRLVTRNYPTAEALEFDDHSVDLFNRPELQRVRLCYVLNEFGTQLDWVGIAAHSKGKLLWKIELDDGGVVAASPRLPLNDDIDTAELARLKSITDKASEVSKHKNG